MRRLGFGSMVAGLVMALGLASASQADDAFPFAIGCGGACGIGTLVGSDLLVNAVPGGVFVVTVAHLAPTLETAFRRGKPVECRSVEFRVDTLRIGAQEVEVEFGDRLELAPGQSTRIIQSVDMDANTQAAAYDMDQLAFRLRAEKLSSPCKLVASGAFFEDASSTHAVPFSLLVDDGAKGKSKKR
ncbi:MAG: hypothetical protein HKP30_07995 [Myxococcales bacterium]|nr:hypothetical protein [Myxococcales bacterium]